ncbi:MAG: DUF1588 domain-containing protein [Pirellulales bacterium]|nr:DUF1588 domain-containing protein [Pirellulales bacterium]
MVKLVPETLIRASPAPPPAHVRKRRECKDQPIPSESRSSGHTQNTTCPSCHRYNFGWQAVDRLGYRDTTGR